MTTSAFLKYSGTISSRRILLHHRNVARARMVATIQLYLHTHMGLIEDALAKVAPLPNVSNIRYRLNDQLGHFWVRFSESNYPKWLVSYKSL